MLNGEKFLRIEKDGANLFTRMGFEGKKPQEEKGTALQRILIVISSIDDYDEFNNKNTATINHKL